MKSKFFVIVAIIALVGFVVNLDYGDVWAQQKGPQEEPPEPFDEAKYDIAVEFTTFPDVSMAVGGVSQPPPPEDLFTIPPDAAGTPNPANSFAYPHAVTPGQGVDAIANWGDAKFIKLIANFANLLVSFEGDPMYTGTAPPTGPVAVYMECIGGTRNPHWNQKGPLPGKIRPFGLDFDAATLNPDHPLDALEVWGPRAADDANMYSLQGDPKIVGVDDTRMSVRKQWDGEGYITHDTIAAACVALGYWDHAQEIIDLDALMVRDYGGGYNGIWDEGDIIIFSIRAAGNWDGGEIVVLPFGGPADFLRHGTPRVPWNTAFPVAVNFKLNPATEEVDAIEAYPSQFGCPQTPTLTQWGLVILVALLIISTVFVLLKRRKAVVRA